MVGENGMLFHSTQATSHALQPIQVVVSISLQTSRSRCASLPGTEPAWPEIFCTRSVACPIPDNLRFLYLHKKALELGRIRIRVNDRGRQRVHQHARSFPFVLGDSAEAPVDGNADLKSFLAVNLHRLDAL